jgi:hypothetical protein
VGFRRCGELGAVLPRVVGFLHDVLDAFRRVRWLDQFGLAVVLSARSRLDVLDYGNQGQIGTFLRH